MGKFWDILKKRQNNSIHNIYNSIYNKMNINHEELLKVEFCNMAKGNDYYRDSVVIKSEYTNDNHMEVIKFKDKYTVIKMYNNYDTGKWQSCYILDREINRMVFTSEDPDVGSINLFDEYNNQKVVIVSLLVEKLLHSVLSVYDITHSKQLYIKSII